LSIPDSSTYRRIATPVEGRKVHRSSIRRVLQSLYRRANKGLLQLFNVSRIIEEDSQPDAPMTLLWEVR
jgi:hypothetical protein